MKKFLLILLLGFVVATQVYPQNADKGTTALKTPYSGDDVLWRSFQKTKEVLRVILIQDSTNHKGNIDSLVARLSRAFLNSLAAYLHPSTLSFVGDSLSISAGAIDSSTTILGTTWFSWKLFTPDGYIKTAFNRAMTNNVQVAYPYSSTFGYDHYASSVATKIYIKNTGTTTAHVIRSGSAY